MTEHTPSKRTRGETQTRHTWEGGRYELRREEYWMVEEDGVGSQLVNQNTFRECSLYDRGKMRVITSLRWRVLDGEDTIHIPENITAEMGQIIDPEYEYAEGDDEHRQLARFITELQNLRFAQRKAATLRAFEDARLGGGRGGENQLYADSVDRSAVEHYHALQLGGLTDGQIQLGLVLAEDQEELGWTARQLREAIEAVV